MVMENNKRCRIVGIGRIRIKMIDGMVTILDAMRHVLDLRRNRISLSTLESKWYRYIVECGVLKISKRVHVLLNGHRKSQLYVL